ncbi:MAG: hypothetical protein ACOX2R_00250 [Anaerolineae bacterium]
MKQHSPSKTVSRTHGVGVGCGRPKAVILVGEDEMQLVVERRRMTATTKEGN